MLRCVNELANAVKVTMCGANGGAAAAAPWWRLPVEVLLLWATRAARSAWSVPVAIALLGIAVRGRRMRRQSKAVARLRLVLDDKECLREAGPVIGFVAAAAAEAGARKERSTSQAWLPAR
ncbi:uncharacterized protein LOC119288388 isoform X1 [Triticum dicoccoides]|uniref:uncharacterized protein LOC119288388 isoform X1 n=1 Tax=Triticum dicoccoides TaxID=85692 RepID=UPI00188E86A8|nr:uncharacterized protein LOC119288388 isoform X1 [Triticum dicoccoides]